MISFSPTQRLEKGLRTLQTAAVRAAGVVQTLEGAEREWIQHWALISTIGASTRIENAVLTDAEIDWVDTALSQDGHPTAFAEQRTVILDKLSKDRERSVEEVVGCREMLHLVYAQSPEWRPLTEGVIRGLHKTLLSFYPAADYHAGGYKASPNQVVAINHATGERRSVLAPTPPGLQTDTAMHTLVEWYNRTMTDAPWPLLVATEFVFRFLAIHPFQDGNGRVGRALFLLTLLQCDDPVFRDVVPLISIDRQIERHRARYYAVLQQTSGGRYHPDPSAYHWEPLVWFFVQMVQFALKDIDGLRQRYAAMIRLSESAVQVLACFKSDPQRRLQVADLVAATSLPRRTVQNSLVSLTAGGFLQRRGAGRATRYQLIF